MATGNNDTPTAQVRLDLSKYRTPTRAIVAIQAEEERLEKRERALLNAVTGVEPGAPGTAEDEQALEDVQAQLATLDFVWKRLGGMRPKEVYPEGCAPAWDAEARERGQRLHLDMVHAGYGEEDERRSLVADTLGRSEGARLRFRWLTEEEVRHARRMILGLGVAEREETRGDSLPAEAGRIDVEATERGGERLTSLYG